MLTKKQALELKKQVKTVDDLENIVKREELDCSEQEIEDVYEEIMALDESNLDDISGGFLTSKYDKRIVKCRNCHKRMEVYEGGMNSKCYHCGVFNNINNCDKGC